VREHHVERIIHLAACRQNGICHVAVGDVAAHERDARQHVGAGDHLETPGIVAHVVDDGTLGAGEEALHDPRADAAEGACHQRGHGSAR
jgi:hypothetical protein